jgi:hypothetical protein
MNYITLFIFSFTTTTVHCAQIAQNMQAEQKADAAVLQEIWADLETNGARNLAALLPHVTPQELHNRELWPHADHFDQTCLHQAAWKNNYEAVKLLLEHGVDVNIKDASGTTPLFHAVAQSSVKIVELLIKHNADVNIITLNKTTPLMNAKEPAIIQLLLAKGSHVHTKDSKGMTALSIAVSQGPSKRVRLLTLGLLFSQHISDQKKATVIAKALAPGVGTMRDTIHRSIKEYRYYQTLYAQSKKEEIFEYPEDELPIDLDAPAYKGFCVIG